MSAALLALVETLERQRREVIELYIAVLSQEPRDEADRDGGAGEAGRVEGSAARLPSEQAENKPDGPATLAAAPIREMDRAEEAVPLRPIPGSGKRPEDKPVDPEAGSVSHVGAGESPAPIPLKRVFVLRPHCLHPHDCAGYGTQHCHVCAVKAAGQNEAAA